MTIDVLLEQIDSFLARHSMAPSTLGVLAINDSSLISGMRQGRKPRAPTIAKIVDAMKRHDEEREKADAAALDLVRRHGPVIVEQDGIPRLESNSQIDAPTFHRLLTDGRLVPNGDAFFDCASQTYRAAELSDAA